MNLICPIHSRQLRDTGHQESGHIRYSCYTNDPNVFKCSFIWVDEHDDIFSYYWYQEINDKTYVLRGHSSEKITELLDWTIPIPSKILKLNRFISSPQEIEQLIPKLFKLKAFS